MDIKTAVNLLATWAPTSFPGCIRVFAERDGVQQYEIWTGDPFRGFGNLAAAVSLDMLREAVEVAHAYVFAENNKEV